MTNDHDGVIALKASRRVKARHMILERELKTLCNISVSRNEWKSVLLRREFYESELDQRKTLNLNLIS